MTPDKVEAAEYLSNENLLSEEISIDDSTG